MLAYFIIFLIPAFISLSNVKVNSFVWVVIGFFYTIVIGLRHQVGGDWYNYIFRFRDMEYSNFTSVITGEDPGYYLVNLFMYEIGLNIYAVNFICAIFFIIGLLKLAKLEYNPWMVLAVSVPYTMIVVSMGYTRQAVALGFVMWSITYLKVNKMFGFFFFVFLAATFHKSAVLMIGLGIFAGDGSRFLKIIAIGFIGMGLYFTFLASHADALVTNYVDAQMQSSGAFIRTFMNLVPAILLILYRKRWKEFFDDFTFWFIIAILSIISFAIVGAASTAVDRMALYLLPIQMIVFSRLGILMSHQMSIQVVNICILIYYFLVLTVWLNFAVNAFSWVPYDNLLFVGLF